MHLHGEERAFIFSTSRMMRKGNGAQSRTRKLTEAHMVPISNESAVLKYSTAIDAVVIQLSKTRSELYIPYTTTYKCRFLHATQPHVGDLFEKNVYII